MVKLSENIKSKILNFLYNIKSIIKSIINLPSRAIAAVANYFLPNALRKQKIGLSKFLIMFGGNINNSVNNKGSMLYQACAYKINKYLIFDMGTVQHNQITAEDNQRTTEDNQRIDAVNREIDAVNQTIAEDNPRIDAINQIIAEENLIIAEENIKIAEENFRFAEFLLSLGANPNLTVEEAIQYKNDRALRNLLVLGAKIDTLSNGQKSRLYEAYKNNDNQTAKFIAQFYEAEELAELINKAIDNKDLNIASSLLKLMQPIDQNINKSGFILYQACVAGDLEKVKFLIENGANPRACLQINSIEDTPLQALTRLFESIKKIMSNRTAGVLEMIMQIKNKNRMANKESRNEFINEIKTKEVGDLKYFLKQHFYNLNDIHLTESDLELEKQYLILSNEASEPNALLTSLQYKKLEIVNFLLSNLTSIEWDTSLVEYLQAYSNIIDIKNNKQWHNTTIQLINKCDINLIEVQHIIQGVMHSPLSFICNNINSFSYEVVEAIVNKTSNIDKDTVIDLLNTIGKNKNVKPEDLQRIATLFKSKTHTDKENVQKLVTHKFNSIRGINSTSETTKSSNLNTLKPF